MYAAPEKLIALNKSNVEAAVSVANIWLDGPERLVEVQLAAGSASGHHSCDSSAHRSPPHTAAG